MNVESDKYRILYCQFSSKLRTVHSQDLTIYTFLPNSLSSIMLHFTMMSCSTLAGFKEALLGVTMLPATLKTLSLFELAAGTAITTLAR